MIENGATWDMDVEKGAVVANEATTLDEEQDNLSHSTKKVKTNGGRAGLGRVVGIQDRNHFDEKRKSTYKEKDLNGDIFTMT